MPCVEDGTFMRSPTGLEITELSMDGATVMLAAGDLDIATAPSLCARLHDLRGERVVLDLSSTAFCDVAAMRAIVDESRVGRAVGGLFVLVAPAGCPARRLIEVTGMVGVVEVHDDRARAISRVRPRRFRV
jgi:anti-anti-sigma factor